MEWLFHHALLRIGMRQLCDLKTSPLLKSNLLASTIGREGCTEAMSSGILSLAGPTTANRLGTAS